MKRRNVPILPFVCEFNSSARLIAPCERIAPSLEFLPDAMVLEAEWRANPALTQTLEEERAQQSSRAPGAIFLRQARFALVLRKLLREQKRIARSRYEFSCAGLRAHVKETSRYHSKRHDRARPELSARWIHNALSECVGGRLADRKLVEQLGGPFFPGQNNIPFCSAENARANHSKDSYRFDDRLTFLAAMGGTAFALELQRSKIENQKSKMKKAILLAGGAGTRLYPLTKIVCKQLLPIYDKPMICYPLATLMLGGLREVLIISTPKDLPMLQDYLGDGTQLGIRIEYAEQPKPEGIAQAFLIGAKFIGDSGASLILGDNIFYGKLDFYRDALAIERGACIFGYQVRDPERYGVVEFDADGKAISLEEKPKQPKSHFAVPGLYVYDEQVVDLCRTLRPSARGELEITDLNLLYLKRDELHVKLLSRGMAWLDTGTTKALLEASNYIATIEHRQGLKIACLEEVALRMGFIAQSDLAKIIDRLPKNEYRDYLQMVCDEGPGAGPEPVG